MAISVQPFGVLLSFSYSRSGEIAYEAAGVACVIRVVVTIPVDFPNSCAHFRMVLSWFSFCCAAVQFWSRTSPDTPTVP